MPRLVSTRAQAPSGAIRSASTAPTRSASSCSKTCQRSNDRHHKGSTVMTPQPFELRIPDAAIADLKTRLGLTRLPAAAPGEPWAYGSSVDYVRDLVSYWKDRFDWRAQEAALNQFPQFKVPLHDVDLHYLHVPGVGPNPYPLLLLHGWPGSVFEFLDIIPRLTDPARFGGDPKDAFTVVAPSLPGYGLSFRPGQKRFVLRTSQLACTI